MKTIKNFRMFTENNDSAVHLAHCFQGEYKTTCKYGEDETCPARSSDIDEVDEDDPMFRAILAKNQLARMISGDDTIQSKDTYLECLKDIERAIGEGNQPSVEDIFNNPNI